jgi:hypothetical protein
MLARGDYDVTIASPSMATGVSIEIQGVVSEVYGVFNGCSATDADMAQALDRLREPVPRIVWCAEVGSNYSPVSRSPNAMQIKQDLLEQTIATTQIIRSSLRADTLGATLAVSAQQRANYDWRSDPNVNLWATFSAEQNRSMSRLRTALLVRLRHEGKRVEVWSAPSDREVLKMLRQITREINQMDAASIVAAPVLTTVQFLALQTKETHSPEEAKATLAVSAKILCWKSSLRDPNIRVERTA